MTAKKIILLIYLGFVFISCPELFSQSFQKEVNYYQKDVIFYKEFSVKEYILPDIGINCIGQSREGYLYLGTSEGLIRFNGVSFSKLSTQGHKNLLNITSIAFKDGLIYLGSQNGLYALDRLGLKALVAPDTGNPNKINSISAQNNLLFSIKDKGLFVVNDGKIIKFNHSLSSTLNCTKIELLNGSLYFATDDGLFILKGNKVTQLNENSGLASSQIISVFPVSDSVLYVGTPFGINKIVHGRVVEDNIAKLFKNKIVFKFIKDNKDNLWIGASDGLYLLREGKVISHIFENIPIHEIIIDHENNIWVAGKNNRLYKINNYRMRILNKEKGLSSDWVWCANEDKNGDLYLGTYGYGYNILHGNEIKKFKLKGAAFANSIRSIAWDEKGRLWLATLGDGLKIIDRGKTKEIRKKDGLTCDNVRALFLDSKKRMWVGTEAGINVFTAGKNMMFNGKNGLSDSYVRMITEDKNGIIWLGTRKGVFYYDGNFRQINDRQLMESEVFTIHIDDENYMWITTYNNGLFIIKDGKVNHLTAKNGLPTDQYNHIIEDDYGNMWISSDSKIIYLSKKIVYDYLKAGTSNIKYYQLSVEDGCIDYRFTGGSMTPGIKRKNGEIVFTGETGAVFINPKDYFEETATPNLVFDKISVDGNVQLDTIHEFKAGTKNIEFSYSLLSFNNPKNNIYEVYLEGFDDKWRDMGQQTSISFASLPYGNYILKIRAYDKTKPEKIFLNQLNFSVAPFFYQTIWFYILCMMIVGFAFWLISISRIRMLKQREAQLSFLVDLRTKELLASEEKLKQLNHTKDILFSMISHDMKNLSRASVMFSDSMEENYEKMSKEKIYEYIIKSNRVFKDLFRLVNNVFQWAKNQIKNGNAIHEEVNVNILAGDVANMFIGQTNDKDVTIVNNIPEEIIVIFDRSILNTLFVNLISNAIKYSHRNGVVELNAEKADGGYVFFVKDYGVGMNSEDINKIFSYEERFSNSGTEGEWGSGLGLKISKEILNRAGGELYIESTEGSGTIVKFKIPVT